MPSTVPALTPAPTQLLRLTFQQFNSSDRCFLLPISLDSLFPRFPLPSLFSLLPLPHHPHHLLAYSKLCFSICNKYFLIAKPSNLVLMREQWVDRTDPCPPYVISLVVPVLPDWPCHRGCSILPPLCSQNLGQGGIPWPPPSFYFTHRHTHTHTYIHMWVLFLSLSPFPLFRFFPNKSHMFLEKKKKGLFDPGRTIARLFLFI